MESQRTHPILYVTYKTEIHAHCCIHHYSSLWFLSSSFDNSNIWLIQGWHLLISFSFKLWSYFFWKFFVNSNVPWAFWILCCEALDPVKTLWRMLTDVSNQSTFRLMKVPSCNLWAVVPLSGQFSKLCYAVCVCPARALFLCQSGNWVLFYIIIQFPKPLLCFFLSVLYMHRSGVSLICVWSHIKLRSPLLQIPQFRDFSQVLRLRSSSLSPSHQKRWFYQALLWQSHVYFFILQSTLGIKTYFLILASAKFNMLIFSLGFFH